MTRRLAYAAILLSNLLLAAAFAVQQVWLGLAASLVLGLVWSLTIPRQNPRLFSAWFALQAVLAVWTLLTPTAPLLSLLGFWCGLAAWDLSSFTLRLPAIVPPEAATALERSHLKRLAIVQAAGLATALAGLLLRFELRFIPAFLLGLLAFVTLALAVRATFTPQK